jgi:glycosyltransferase involved in cell wall biosynthesis
MIVALSNDPKITDLSQFYRGSYQSLLQTKVIPDIAGKVFFKGAVPHHQLVEHYGKADVFVFPSVWDEPSGNPPIEAMAAGVPVVSTRTGGTPEYVADGKTGLLVEPGNAGALAEAILRLLTDEDLRTTIGKAARNRAVEVFSYKRLAENLLCEYQNICVG